MPVKTRNLFISHSWNYGDAYNRLCDLLDAASYFSYKNYSVPSNDPIHNARSHTLLRAAIQRQMAPCHVVMIIAGVYATYSKWIDEEMSIAKQAYSYAKPVLAITPWGAQRISAEVRHAADLVVGWNTNSIVQGIRALAP